MASKKNIKKDVKQMVYDIMDDCDFIVVSGGKGADKAVKLMDDAVEFYETIVPKINAAKKKADFKSVRAEIEEKAIGFVQELNKMG
ncbi:MAG: hypothetical protein MK105_07475 [Crocinitomicaceae bacterium]|nr:hypothetical protein [Crocinitomicaceae bacterium]